MSGFLLIRIFVILPTVLLSSCVAGGYIGGDGHFNWLIAVIVSFIALIFYMVWDGKQENARFTKHASSLGINPEYVACYDDNGIAIDNTNKKLFAGKINKGKVFHFNEISSIEWKDEPFGKDMKYFINVKTKDFDLPQIKVGFASNKGMREQAYEKLRAALNIA